MHLAFIMGIYLLAHTFTNKKYKQCIHNVGINLSETEWPSGDYLELSTRIRGKSNSREMTLALR